MRQQFHANCVAVDNEMNNGLAKLINIYEKDAIKQRSNEPFHKIFWAQQSKALTVKKTKSQMQWHSLMIRWAFYLHHRSSGTYKNPKNQVLLLCHLLEF